VEVPGGISSPTEPAQLAGSDAEPVSRQEAQCAAQNGCKLCGPSRAPVEWCKLCGPRGAMPQAFFCNPDARLCHNFQFQKDPFFENKKILKF
jgi:hypothetical protein